MSLIHPGWLLLAFILGAIGAIGAIIFITTRSGPAPSKRQRELFLAMRTAMDETRRLVVEVGPAEFLTRIDILRGVSIEQVTSSAHRAQMFLHEALMAMQVLDTCDRTPCGDVQRAWCRALYAGKDLVLTVLYPNEEAPSVAPVEKGAPS